MYVVLSFFLKMSLNIGPSNVNGKTEKFINRPSSPALYSHLTISAALFYGQFILVIHSLTNYINPINSIYY